MLKITLLDSAGEFRFRLEGKLSGPWVAELRQCWLTASSTTAGRRTVVDLDDVEYVDPAGETLLGDMSREGVRLHASTVFMRGVVEQIAGAGQYGRVEGKSARSANALVCADPPGPYSRAV
jgi:anti-anti-sigma regulatory factor